MANSPLQIALKDWNTRLAQAQAAGIPIDKIKPIAQQDINKVASGSTGMTTTEAALAVNAAAGNPVITDPKPRTGLLSVLENIPGDVKNTVWGFIPGMAKFAEHLPSETKNTVKAFTDPAYAKDQGYQTGGHGLHRWAEALQNVAKLPLSPLLPGVHTAAALTTSQGRQSLEQHPVGTALDVAPYASVLGRLGAFGSDAEAGSALAKLQEGHPLGALGKATKASDALQTILSKFNLDTASMNKVFKPHAVATRGLRNDATKLVNELQKEFKDIPPKELARLSNLADHYDPTDPSLNPRDAAVMQNARRLVDAMAEETGKAGQTEHIPPAAIEGAFANAKGEASKYNGLRIPNNDGHSFVYPVTSPVIKSYHKILATSDKVKTLMDKVANEHDPVKKLDINSKLITAKSKLVNQQQKFAESLMHNAPASFHNVLEESARKRLVGAIDRTKYQGASLAGAIKDIQSGSSWQDFAAIVGEDETHKIIADSVSSWLDLARQGMDPIWMHHVDPSRFEQILYPRPLSASTYVASTVKAKTFNFAPHMSNIAVSLSDAGIQLLRQNASNQFVETVLRPLTTTVGDMKAQVKTYLSPKFSNPVELQHAIQEELRSKGKVYDSATPLGPTKELSSARDTDLFLPTKFAKAIEDLKGYDGQLPANGAYSKVMKAYKFSVLTGPRHIVHVAVGGLMFGMLREPGMLLELPKAIDIVKRGEMPVEMPQTIYDLETPFIQDLATGKTMASHYAQAIGSKFDALRKFEDFVSNVERTSVMLAASKRGLDFEEALNTASKTFIDMDRMAPIERTIIKNVFPFYAFTKQLFRYLLSYPVDHPIRAAILSRFAQQEQEEWNSGLPKQYQDMFFMGHGDNVTAVDFKAINPFRSFGNDFTLTGFISGLNPAIQSAMEMTGINTVSGTPPLYPQTSYDPQTGSLVADRPKNSAINVLASFIPEVNAIDHFVGLTDRMRSLKTSNPEAYRRQLFSALNLPFDWATVNKPQVLGKAELNRYKAAQAAVSSAEKTGNFSAANRYNMVPFEGQLVPPNVAQQYWEQLAQQLNIPSGVSEKAVVKPPKRPRTRA